LPAPANVVKAVIDKLPEVNKVEIEFVEAKPVLVARKLQKEKQG